VLWERLPVIGGLLRSARVEVTRAGVAVLTNIAELVIEQIDVTAMVRDQLDLDAIMADLDIEAIIGRIDLVGLADQIIEGMDLPAIIRECTGTATAAEVMTEMETQIDRMLGWERAPEKPQ
jgi:hypothetical protein